MFFLVGERSKVEMHDLALINEYVSTSNNIEPHCKTLIELLNLRNLYNGMVKTQNMISGGCSSVDVRSHIEAVLGHIAESNTDYRVSHIKEGVSQVFEALDGKDDSNRPLLFGFLALDKVIGGIFGGEFVVIGARPAMGKTAFVLNGIMNMSKAGEKVLMFSLEMRTNQLVTRFLSSEGEVNNNSIRNRKLTKKDMTSIASAAETIYNSNIYINSSRKNTVHDIKAIARMHLREHPDTRCIVIDYVQLIKDSKEYEHDTRLANKEKSSVLCDLAVEIGIPVIALSQVGRQVEARPNKRPMPSDLQETGKLEADANIIGFLYCGYKYGDQYENKDGNMVKYKEDDVDFIIAKNREGQTGTVRLKFKGEYSKFYNINENDMGVYEEMCNGITETESEIF